MDPFLGEIRMFAGNYAPESWLLCDGSLQSVNQYQALFALVGTTYGGNGSSTFGLPDLRGRLAVGEGAGPTLTPRQVGQTGGASQVQVTMAQFPSHTHTFSASNQPATMPAVAQNVGLAQPVGNVVRYAPPAQNPTVVAMDPDSVSWSPGGSQSHNNVMPFLAINFIICVNGLYPSQP